MTFKCKDCYDSQSEGPCSTCLLKITKLGGWPNNEREEVYVGSLYIGYVEKDILWTGEEFISAGYFLISEFCERERYYRTSNIAKNVLIREARRARPVLIAIAEGKLNTTYRKL